MSRILTAVVVGAGTAGCTVAAALASKGIRVRLVEPGGEPVHQGERDFFRVLHAPNSVTSQLVSTTSEVAARAYTQASVCGGGGALNAMVSLPGEPADYDEWANDLRCSGWSWHDVQSSFSSLAVPSYRATHHELGRFGELFFSSVDHAEKAPLAWSEQRVTSLSRMLDVQKETEMIDLPFPRSADGILMSDGRVVAATLSDGGVLEADGVVVCAGALATPAILRSIADEIDESAREHIGNNLQDHPAVMLTCETSGADSDGFVVTAIATMRDVAGRAVGQLMAYNHVGDGSSRVGVGVSLLEVYSRGHIDDSNFASFNMLSDERDVVNMRAVLRWALAQVSTPEFSSMGTWMADDAGTTCGELASASDAEIDAWLRRNVGFQSHAAGSSRMGDTPRVGAVSTRGEVFGVSNLWVADASVFPRIPRANTNLPVMMVATRIAESIAGGA